MAVYNNARAGWRNERLEAASIYIFFTSQSYNRPRKTLPADWQDELRDKYWREMGQEWFKIDVSQDYKG
jgi:hypothetical protein